LFGWCTFVEVTPRCACCPIVREREGERKRKRDPRGRVWGERERNRKGRRERETCMERQLNSA